MDYHGGQWFSDPQEMLARVMPLLDDPDRMRAIGRAALGVLLAEPLADGSRVAALGYGAGGTIGLELGRDGVDLAAIAAVNPALWSIRPADSANIRCPVLVCTGSEDPLVTPEHRRAFGEEMQAAGVEWQLNVYGGAEHAFHHPPVHPDGTVAEGTEHRTPVVPGVGHHPAHARRAWRDVVALLRETLDGA